MKTADPANALATPGAQAAFVAAMQSPAPYAALHEVRAPIRCVETHVSWVFLTGPYAYKVKKPLRLSFLDYSSPARREFLCHEELRLNRRHAPELYVDVVPITGSPASPRVGGTDAAAFEHALRMVQFDPALELAQLLRARQVAPDELGELGVRLALMHRAAAVAPLAGDYGAPAVVHRVALDNCAELAPLLPAAADLDSLAQVRSSLDVTFERLQPMLESRRHEGFVRECHGDLHCGNVVRWQGRLVAFDGIEFDPALRYIDVANDLAFLSMDLASHQRADLRRTLLDAWTSSTGDYAAIELLPYYETGRALVRAKVAALRNQQARGTGAATLAHEYLGWARERARAQPPLLVVMAGLSGSGKTWLARRIAERLDALHLRSDVERKRLAGLGALERSGSAPDAGIYTLEYNARTYDRLRDCAAHCLRGGEAVIVDAANLRRTEREAFVKLAAALGVHVRLVHCHASPAVLHERVAARERGGDDASEATVALLARQPGYWEPLSEAELALTRDVDSGSPESVEAVLQDLARKRAADA